VRANVTEAAETAKPRVGARPLRRLAAEGRFSGRDLGILLVLIVMFAGLAAASPAFRTSANLSNVLDQASVNGIAACGVTLAIVSGAFDLSLGSVSAVAAIVAVMVASGHGTVVGFLAALGAGIVLGALNGVFIAFGRINSFIATLATSFAYGGLATAMTGGQIVSTTAGGFQIAEDSWAGITDASWLFIGVAIVTGAVLAFTGFGRGLYAIGGNAEAARLAGLRIWAYRVAVLAISGGCAALAGIVAASRIGSAQPTVNSDLALTAIAAAVVGGTSILGGEGTVWRAVIGVLILELISNGFDLLNINPIYQDVVYGALILAAVGLDQLLRRRRL
jgi:ribose transport system permease protein